ncbi:MAG: hypothetical protein JWM47_4524 [Acidimicrobiales bacterium]|nr:hypothetical protein [Acidimicrobiales bacterium]
MSERVHVFPLEDVVEHDTNNFDECICGPEVQYLDDGCIVIHHALDGREHDEPDHDHATCPLCSSERGGGHPQRIV